MSHQIPVGWKPPQGAYATAVAHGPYVYTSGHVGADPTTGELAGPSLEQQVRQAIANVEAVLRTHGSSLAYALKVTVYLADIDRDFAEFDTLYRELVPAPHPARTTVGASMRRALVEIDAIAVTAELWKDAASRTSAE